MYGYENFCNGRMITTYIRKGVVEFMRLCEDKGHILSLWSDRSHVNVTEIADYLTHNHGIEFEYLLSHKHKLLGGKYLYPIDGDLLFDDRPDINYVPGDPFVIAPSLTESTIGDRYFYDLLSKFEFKDNWSSIDFL